MCTKDVQKVFRTFILFYTAGGGIIGRIWGCHVTSDIISFLNVRKLSERPSSFSWCCNSVNRTQLRRFTGILSNVPEFCKIGAITMICWKNKLLSGFGFVLVRVKRTLHRWMFFFFTFLKSYIPIGSLTAIENFFHSDW